MEKRIFYVLISNRPPTIIALKLFCICFLTAIRGSTNQQFQLPFANFQELFEFQELYEVKEFFVLQEFL